MGIYSYKRKAQTIVETGCFALLILVGFAFLVTYIQKMNGEQYTLMENFRRSIKKSHDQNKIVSHAYLNDSIQADVDRPLEGQKIMRSASGYAHWAVPGPTYGSRDVREEEEGTRKTQYYNNSPERKFYYKINEQEYEISKDANISGVQTEYTTRASGQVTITQSSGSISSTRTMSVNEDLSYYILGHGEKTQSRSDSGSRSLD